MKMHSARRCFLPLLLFSLFVPAVASGQDATLMRWRFQPGETFQYQIEQTTKQTMNTGGQTIEMDMSMVIDMSWKVDDVDSEGAATVKQAFERMRVSMAGSGMQADYDTEKRQDINPALAGLAKLFDEFVGVEVMVKMDPRGEVLDTEIDPKLIEALQRAGGGPMGAMFTEEGIEEMITSSTTMAVLPREAVKPGDTWKDSKELVDQMLGKLALEVNSKFRGFEQRDDREVAVIEFSVDFSKAELPEDLGGVKLDIKDQKMSGSFYFDPQLGKMTGSEAKSEMSLDVTLEEQTLNQKSVTTATATLTPVSAKQ